jgi:dynein heavy chain
LGLLGDLFPGYNPTRKIDEEFAQLVAEACKENQMHPDPDFIDKCLQLREIMAIRHCTFIMGPAGAAKTRV